MIKLGAKVRDPFTGFKGIAVSRIEYLFGCIRIGIQGPLDKEGKVSDPLYFDEPQLESIEPKKAKKKANHGPRPDPSPRINPSKR